MNHVPDALSIRSNFVDIATGFSEAPILEKMIMKRANAMLRKPSVFFA